jgi:DNA polymerase-1
VAEHAPRGSRGAQPDRRSGEHRPDDLDRASTAGSSPAEERSPIADRASTAGSSLFLIDGNSLVYRAFFALPETIATSRGFPTNAIFGFASMLVKLMTEHGQRPTIVVWDAGSSGRKEAYAEYKAGRESRPDLLREQWPHLEPLVEAFGYANVSVEGYEADDVIASLAARAHARGIEVTIVTGDRDAFQLIQDPLSPGAGGVRVMATGRGITDTKLYDRDAVIERYGIAPELIPDFYGLKGDTSDNIPGVPGIGDKTASQLLQRFGDLETVLASVDEISGAKRKQNLVEHADDARVSKRLATAVRDVDFDLDLDGPLAGEPDRTRLRETFREFELRDPLRRLEEALGSEEAAAPRAAPAERREVNARAIDPAGLSELGDGPAVLVAQRPQPPEGGCPVCGRSAARSPIGRAPDPAPSPSRDRCASPPTPVATRLSSARRPAASPSCWPAGASGR